MKPVPDLAFAHAHLDSLLAAIPLARAMQIALRDCDGESLTLAAPLAPNVNDKGCAFGGSLAGLTTLAGWGLIALKLESLGLECEVYVQDSTIRYLTPVWGELVATAMLAEGESWQTFLEALAARGRGRLRLACRVPLADGKDACTLDARFVAVRAAN
ncbi:MAG: YiiD C-terminal domain-containing protein [Proteobacteria bacterium]|uniref:YiiD C-terminal domain-containing protein n=1 Tax=Rudaea sp. TaxID=2136325 RepID=UPI001DEE413B|nr:YiiD C-terminal domain-containing protein [Pseudomonadota bacterium]MBS0568058.1 YiiD C-terminal domain-containing protein [Pseudomonadota bacterium]